MSQKEKYQEEYEKYKHIQLELGKYKLSSNEMIEYEITFLDDEKEIATLLTLSSKNIKNKTYHWCRKNLIKIPNDSVNFYIKRLEEEGLFLCDNCNYQGHLSQKVCTKCGQIIIPKP